MAALSGLMVLLSEPGSYAATPTPPCCLKLPARFPAAGRATDLAAAMVAPVGRTGMVKISGGEFVMGDDSSDARPDESPKHRVRVSTFWIDKNPVTNGEFRRFVEATHYVTTAERPPELADIMKQLPPGTPPPTPAQLVAASLVFHPTTTPVENFNDISQWWSWVPHADWRHPEGPSSSIAGKDNYPVVQVSYDDALAYAHWAGQRLPTEAEWEFAARGGLKEKPFAWGDAPLHDGKVWRANTWQGTFPVHDTGDDGFAGLAPVGSFPPNGYGLDDMAGNVWEWVSDWYRPDTYATEAQAPVTVDPPGPAVSYDPAEPQAPKRVIRGGSFLCNDAYCSGYRVSARMKSTPDTSTNHIGFRCVADDKTAAASGLATPNGGRPIAAAR